MKKERKKKLAKGISLVLILSLTGNVVIPTFNTSNVYARISGNLPVSYINEEFPSTYKPYIDELKKIYPNSVFKAVHTNVDWNLAIKHETYETNLGISTIYHTNSDAWKHRPNGVDINVDGGYVAASKEAVKYVLDPRNSLTKEHIFQFESLNYSDKTSSVDAIDKVLSSTPMTSTGQYGNKYKNNHNWITMDKTYASYIYEAGKKNNISPTHIATRIIQETGGDIVNNRSVYGSYPGFTGLYNFFNIGATPGANGNSAIINGLSYARKKGWTTPEISIREGSKTLADDYIKWGQNTIYFQKFDVNNPGQAKHLFGSQYMTHILAPRSESLLTYKAYQKANMLTSPFEFHIPVYLNMPSSTVDYPGTGNNILGGSTEEVKPLNTKIYLDDKIVNGTDTFNLRSSPSSSNSGNIIKRLVETKEGMENRKIYELISKDITTGWAKIRLSDGLEGYVSLQFVHDYTYIKVESLTLNNNDIKLALNKTFDLKVNINPSNAKYKDLTFESKDNSIATVDSKGKITGKKIGKTEIIVTNKDSNVKVVAKVNIVSDIEKIEFLHNEYTVYLNETIKVIPKITSSFNTEYELSIEDANIAKIENGNIKGIKKGTTNIIAKLKNTNKIAKVTLKVVEKNVETPVIFDESLNVDNRNYITKVNPETKVENLKSKITTTYDLKILDKNGKELSNDKLVGTGTKVKITDNKGLNLEYIVVVYGDVNGDARISPLDYARVKNDILETTLIEGIFRESADVTKDKNISPLDYVQIKNHILGIKDIIQ